MRIKTFIFFLFVNFFVLTIYSHAKEITKIIAKIDNELVTNYDVKNKIITALVLADKEINQKNIDNLKRKSLEDLIQNRLKKIELKKYNFKRDINRINSYLNSISNNNIEELKSAFKENNIDYKIFVDEIDTEFKWRKLIYNTYSKKIEIDPTSINNEIKKITQSKINLVKLNLSEIEILSNNDDRDNEKINQVENEIKNFSFEDAVLKFSVAASSNNKGLIGWVNSSSLSNEILKILNKLEIGQVSEPIRKQNKIIFLKLNDKKVSNYSDINIDQLQKDLIEQKRNELFLLYSNSLLSKLRNTKFIEYYK